DGLCLFLGFAEIVAADRALLVEGELENHRWLIAFGAHQGEYAQWQPILLLAILIGSVFDRIALRVGDGERHGLAIELFRAADGLRIDVHIAILIDDVLIVAIRLRRRLAGYGEP